MPLYNLDTMVTMCFRYSIKFTSPTLRFSLLPETLAVRQKQKFGLGNSLVVQWLDSAFLLLGSGFSPRLENQDSVSH